MASILPSLESAAKFEGLKQDSSFLEESRGISRLLSTLAGEIVAAPELTAEIEDALIQVVGQVFSGIIRSVSQQSEAATEQKHDISEASANLIASCLEVCAGLLQKQWSNSEGVLAQVRVLFGEAGSLERLYTQQGLPEARKLWGRWFMVWPSQTETRRVVLARGLALVKRKVKLPGSGEEDTIVGFDFDTLKHQVKLSKSGETVSVELSGSEIVGPTSPFDIGYTETPSRSSFIRLLLPPTTEEALGRWVTAKIIVPVTLPASSDASSKPGVVTVVTEDGERIDFESQAFWANSSSSNVKFLKHSNESTGDPILTQALAAVETAYADEEQWTWTARLSGRIDKTRSYWQFYVVEKFARAGGIDALNRLVWSEVAELPSVLSVVERVAPWISPEKQVWVADKLSSAIMWKQFSVQDFKTMGGIPAELDASFEHAYKLVLTQLQSPKNAQYLHRYRLQLWFHLVNSSSLPQRLQGINHLVNLVCMGQNRMGNDNSVAYQQQPVVDAATASQFIVQERVIERIFTDKPHVEIIRRSLPLLSFMVARDELNQQQLDTIWSAMLKEEGSTAQAMYNILLELGPAIRNAQLRTWFVTQKLSETGITLKDLEDDDRLRFVAELSLVTLSLPEIMAIKSETPQQQHPGIALLWKFVFDPTSASTPKRIKTALAYLGDLIGSIPVGKKRMAAIDACVKYIQGSDDRLIPQALLLIERILLSFGSLEDDSSTATSAHPQTSSPLATASEPRKSLFSTLFARGPADSRKSAVSSLESKHKLLKLVLAGLEKYSAHLEMSSSTQQSIGGGDAAAVKRRRSTAMLVLKGGGNTTLKNGVGSGNGFGVFSHSEQMAIRLNFVAFLLRTSPSSLRLPEKSLETLWRLGVVEAKTDGSRKVGLEWFARAHSAGTGPNRSPLASLFVPSTATSSRPALGEDAEAWVLQKGFPALLSSNGPGSITALDADVFVDYFLNYNRKTKALKLDGNGSVSESAAVLIGMTDDEDSHRSRAIRSVERLSVDLVGLESLWSLCDSSTLGGGFPDEDDDEEEANDLVFERCSRLLVQLHISLPLKDTRKIQELREAFCNRCVSNIGSAASSKSKANWVRLLKQFLQRVTVSANEMCRIVLLPPLAGIPGSLSRREEAPCTKTGPVLIKVSLNTKLDHLKRVIIPKALDYHGQDAIAVRIVQQHPLDQTTKAGGYDDSWSNTGLNSAMSPNQQQQQQPSQQQQSLASSRFVLIPAQANQSTLRELGLEGLIVLQCYESSQVKSSSYSSFTSFGSFGNRSMLMNEIEEEGEDDNGSEIEEDDAGDGGGEGLMEIEETTSGTTTADDMKDQVDDSLEGEITRLCSSAYDVDPASWPGPFQSSYLTISSVTSPSPSSSTLLMDNYKLNTLLLDLLKKNRDSPDGNRLAFDLWDCIQSLTPLDPKLYETLTTSLSKNSASPGASAGATDPMQTLLASLNPDQQNDPFAALQTLRGIESLALMMTDSNNGGGDSFPIAAFVNKFKQLGGPEKVLDLLHSSSLKKLPRSLETVCGKILFSSCLRWVNSLDFSTYPLTKIISSALEWVAVTTSRSVLRLSLYLVERCLLQMVGSSPTKSSSSLSTEMAEKTIQLILDRLLSPSSTHADRAIVASSLVRYASLCPEINVMNLLLSAAMEELIQACRGEGVFDVTTPQGRHLRRRKSRESESLFLLCARLVAMNCEFKDDSRSVSEWESRVAETLITYRSPVADDGVSQLSLTSTTTTTTTTTSLKENDWLFIGLVRLNRGFVLRRRRGGGGGGSSSASKGYSHDEETVRFLLTRCLFPSGTKAALSSAATVVAQEACLGLLSSLTMPLLLKSASSSTSNESDVAIARQTLFEMLKEEMLLPTVASVSSSSSSGSLTMGRRRFYTAGGGARMTMLANHHLQQGGGPRHNNNNTRIGGGGGAAGASSSSSSFASVWEVDVTRLLMSSPLSSHHHPLQFAGIGNLGATCYQNSLLQQLFHVMGFSTGLLNVTTMSSSNQSTPGQDSDAILHHLQLLFASMYTSSERAVETRPFCSVIKDYDGSPINVAEQKDVQEFCDLLFTRLESCSDSQVKRLLLSSFGGTFLQRTESIEPDKPYKSDRFDPFYLVQVDIKGKSNLKEALDGLVAKTRLVGENRCELPNGGKADATVQTLFAKLPPHLMIHLKRFEFQYETMTKAKLDDYLSFPLELDMESYCSTAGDGSASASGDGKPAAVTTEDANNSNVFKYELNGILVHSGGADSGHYYSFIRERVASVPSIGRQWFEFNDELVWPYAVDRIPRDCFGGHDRFVRANGAVVEVPRSQSAYILVYDRVSTVHSWRGKPNNSPGWTRQSAPPEGDESNEDEFEDDADGMDDGLVSSLLAGRGTQAIMRKTIQGRPFGSMAIPPSLLSSIASAKQQQTTGIGSNPSLTDTGGWADRVVFHPLFARFCRDQLSSLWESSLSNLNTKQQQLAISPLLCSAFDLALSYFCQILSRSCAASATSSSSRNPFRHHSPRHHRSTTMRTAVVEDWISLLERCCRGSPVLAERLVETVTTKTDAWLRPMFLECPSRPCRRRFAELLLLCAESLLIQQDFTEEEGREERTTTASSPPLVPILYQSSSVPRHRVVWLLDMLVHVAESTSSAGGPIPCSELFALLLELIRLNKRAVIPRFSRRYGGPGAFLDMYVRRSYRYQVALMSGAGGGGAGPGSYRVSSPASANKPMVPLALMLGSNPRLSALGELVLELVEHSTPDEIKQLSGTASDRFVEAAIKIRDLSAAVRGAKLFWGSSAVEHLLKRLNVGAIGDSPSPQLSQRSAAGENGSGLTFDDFVVVSDYFRAYPAEAAPFSGSVVDWLVEMITRTLNDPDAFPTDDLINASRCLGTIVLTSKSAMEHFKTQHKKTVVSWPKDLTNAIKLETKRIDQTANNFVSGFGNAFPPSPPQKLD